MNLIVNSILDALYLLVTAVSNFFYFILPDATIPSTMSTSIALFVSLLMPLSWIFDFTVLGACLFTIATVFTGLAMFRFIKFVISAIPFL